MARKPCSVLCCSRGGGGGGNFGTGVRSSILKPTPIIYMAFEKYDLFIYLIVQNVDVHVFICCPLILYRFYIAVRDLFATYT